MLRQINALYKTGYNLTVSGYCNGKPFKNLDIDFIKINKPEFTFLQKILLAIKLFLKLYDSYYFSRPEVVEARKKISEKKYDLIISNDLSSLPLASKLNSHKGIVFDAHEYSPLEFEDKLIWRILFKEYSISMLKKYKKFCVDMFTVSPGLALKYKENFEVYPKVIYNSPYLANLRPSNTSDNIEMVHVGQTIRSRKIELMINIFEYLDPRISLNFYLLNTDNNYMNYLKDLSKGKNIYFKNPVHPEKISYEINKYDLGLFLLPLVNFNYSYALPNKFFEYINAALCVAVGPSGEMSSLVKEHDCGIVFNSFDSFEVAEKLNNLKKEELETYKKNSSIASKKLCFESQEILITESIKNIL